MNPEMDTSEPRVPLQGAVKIFKAGLKSKTWDIHGMPQFIMTTHCEGCEMCNTYTSHVVKASEASTVEIPSREVKKAFWIAWPNIVCHVEDEASSVSDKKVEWYSDCHDNLTDDVRMAENKASVEWDHCQKADEKLVQANSKITELEAKLTELQQELTVLQMQDKRTLIIRDDLYRFLGSDSEPTSGRSSQKRKKGQAFLPAISYGGFFLSKASMSVLGDEPMPMMLASSSQAVGSQTTLALVHPLTLRITPPWGKGDPPISVTGVLPRPLGKTRAGGNMWQHMCSLESPEFKDTLLIARAKKGTKRTPEEHTIILHALKHKKSQAHASQPTPFVIQPGIAKELTSMMQTWLMNEAACPPAVRKEPDNTLNLLDVDFGCGTKR